MPAFNFKAEFSGPIESGIKRQTIRAERRDGRPPCRVGESLTFYTGMRTKACRKLGTGTCTNVRTITIEPNGKMLIDGTLLSDTESIALARADGFVGANAMVSWFKTVHFLPFHGHVINWDPSS